MLGPPFSDQEAVAPFHGVGSPSGLGLGNHCNEVILNQASRNMFGCSEITANQYRILQISLSCQEFI